MGFILGLKLFIIIHTFLAALFLFLYLRSKKIETIASVIGGVLFAFGGYLITKIEFLSILRTAIWLPLILILFSCNIFICAAVAVAISLFAGYPPVLFFIMIFLFVKSLVQNKFKKLVFILFFSILISAIQILPSVEFVLNSVRKSGLTVTDASVWSTHFSDWLSLISPIFLKEEATGLFAGEKCHFG